MVEGSFGILELGELWNDENKFDDGQKGVRFC